MKLKPKIQMQEPRALLYKKYIALKRSSNYEVVYKTTDTKYWQFNGDNKTFEELTGVQESAFGEVVAVSNTTSVMFKELSAVYNFEYNLITHKWYSSTPIAGFPVLSLRFSNVAQYDFNKYYLHKSFVYVKQGGVEQQKLQFIRGNKVVSTTMEIKHSNDNLNATTDDLVVINHRLYSIESMAIDHVHQPRDYAIYTMVLQEIV